VSGRRPDLSESQSARAGSRSDKSGPILVLNSGSSSMKYQLIDVDSGEAMAKGLIERIGEEEGSAHHTGPSGERSWTGSIPDHGAALDIVDRLAAEGENRLSDIGLVAVGHRVVHGGTLFREPVVVDEDVLKQIRDLSTLAPLHNPANADGIEQAIATFPGVPQVAVFDTAFFRSLPEAAATYAIDRELAARHDVRRFGFHGTSHEYVARRVAEELGRDLAELDQIVLHLGNGASASAVKGGVAVETSMGLTPLEGLVMGTRPGDIDPGVLVHLNRVAGLDVDDLDELLNRRSGLLGLAGVNDFRDLMRRMDAGDADAELAFDVYCHRLRKYVGAYVAVLGGVDVITFTAGVGENSWRLRARALAGLERLGIEVDAGRNRATSSQARVISPDGAGVTVMVVPTNEELAIARATAALVAGAR
jgi:acetate kinase